MDNPIICPSVDDLDSVAQQLLQAFPEHRIFAVSGSMGAGKTTFIKAFCRQLGVIDRVSSPTFSLVNEYLRIHDGVVYHFDFYRIKSLQEVMDLGYEDYFYSEAHCFLEWPELIAELLPIHFVYISLQEVDNGVREITWRVHE